MEKSSHFHELGNLRRCAGSLRTFDDKIPHFVKSHELGNLRRCAGSKKSLRTFDDKIPHFTRKIPHFMRKIPAAFSWPFLETIATISRHFQDLSSKCATHRLFCNVEGFEGASENAVQKTIYASPLVSSQRRHASKTRTLAAATPKLAKSAGIAHVSWR